MIMKIVMSSVPFRWWRSLIAYLHGARVHPTALFMGRQSQICIGKGSTIGARAIIMPGQVGEVNVGLNVWISSDVEIQTDTRVDIGDGTSIQRRCTVNGTTRLGRDCILAPSVFISSGTHPIRFKAHLSIREQEKRIAANSSTANLMDRAIWVQDDCWLGAHVVICPGVTIGKGSVVGANAVVTKDVPPYSVVAGSPAKKIGSRLEWKPPMEIDIRREEDCPYFLDGRKIRRDGQFVLEIAPTSPVLFALGGEHMANEIEIEWLAPRSSEIEFCGVKFKCNFEKGTIRVSVNDADYVDGILYCNVKSLSGHTCYLTYAKLIINSDIGS